MSGVRHRVLGSAFVLLVVGASFAQRSESENQVKSAYLYDFAKMTRSPSGQLPDGSHLRICVYGADEEFMDMLRATISGKAINDHSVEVRPAELVGRVKVLSRRLRSEHSEGHGNHTRRFEVCEHTPRRRR